MDGRDAHPTNRNRAYALPPKKPGFLPNLRAATRLLVKNPVSRHRCLSHKKVDTPRALSSGDSWFWRHTLKLAILAAILKPNTRSIEPSIEPNLVSPRGFYLPKRSRITSLPYALRYGLTSKILLFWFWLTLVSLAVFFVVFATH